MFMLKQNWVKGSPLLLSLMVIITLAASFISFSAYADIYKWVDENGGVHYSDTPNAQSSPQSNSKTQAKPFTPDSAISSYDAVTYKPAPTTNRSTSNTANKQQKVVMYSTSWCGYCKKAKKYFQANNIPFVEYNIEKNASAKKAYDKLGATGVPVIIYGKKRMNGFSEAGFKKFYKS